MKNGMKKIITVLSMIGMLVLVGITSNIIVKAEAQVKSIQIKKQPTKCGYNVGEGYTTKGMVVEATMSDGKTKTIDNAEITSFSGVELTEGRVFEQEGWKYITLKYKGAETAYAVAVFDPAKEYFVKFNTDGGKAVDSIKIDASTKAFTLPTTTKNGSTFLGWYHSNGQKYTKYVPSLGPNLDLTAKWGYKITFNANGGKGTMKTGVVSQDYNIPKCGFKKTGYKFVGWSTSKTVKDQNTFYLTGDSSSYISRDKNVTLYAQWVKPSTYTISYVAVKNVKLPAKAIKKYTSGKITQLPYPDVAGEMNFVGWKITKDGKNYGTFIEIPAYMTGNIKLTPELYKFIG